jgi:transposase
MQSFPLFWLPWLEEEVSITLKEGFLKEHAQACVSPDLNPIENVWEIIPPSKKTPNYGISRGRMSHPSHRVPYTCRIYAKAH